MPIKNMAICFLFVTCFASSLLAQSIHKSQLKHLFGSVILRTDRKSLKTPYSVESGGFVNLSFDRSIWRKGRIFPQNPFEKQELKDTNTIELFVGFRPFMKAKEYTREIEEHGKLIVALNGFDLNHSHALLSVWRIRDDSLDFEEFGSRAFAAQRGTIRIRDYAFFPDSTLMVLLESSGGDRYNSWSSYLVVQHLQDGAEKVVLERNGFIPYERNLFGYTDYEIDTSRGLGIRFVMKKYKSVGQTSQEKHLVRSDLNLYGIYINYSETTYVDLTKDLLQSK